MEKGLNDNDNKLLAFCMNRRQTVNNIAKFLNITPASISVKLKKLEKEGLIIIERKGKGKKTFVRTKKGIKTTEYFKIILQELKNKGGNISDLEYYSLLPFDPSNPMDQDKFSAPLKLLYIKPKLVEQRIVLTEEGKKWLKEHSS